MILVMATSVFAVRMRIITSAWRRAGPFTFGFWPYSWYGYWPESNVIVEMDGVRLEGLPFGFSPSWDRE